MLRQSEFLVPLDSWSIKCRVNVRNVEKLRPMSGGCLPRRFEGSGTGSLTCLGESQISSLAMCPGAFSAAAALPG